MLNRIWTLAGVALAVGAFGAGVLAAERLPLAPRHKKWIEEEVVYLISGKEAKAFRALASVADRDQFIEQFWKRRDPTPETPENEFKDEHYRRIAWANERFGSGGPGWRSDRGRIYITWGPPDSVESNPAGMAGFVGGFFSRAEELPAEIWHYRHLPGTKTRGTDVAIVFVDRGGGDYRLISDPKDANIAYVFQTAGLDNPLQYTSTAFNDPATGLLRTDRIPETYQSVVLGPQNLGISANQFEPVLIARDVNRSAGEVLEDIDRSKRFRNLEEEVKSEMYLRTLPFDLSVGAFDAGAGVAYVPLAVGISGRAVTFSEKGDRYVGRLTVRGEVRDVGRGAITTEFNENMDFNLLAATYRRGLERGFTYEKGLRLKPGHYQVSLVVKDEQGRAIGLQRRPLDIAGHEGNGSAVGVSDLTLVEVIERVKDATPSPFRFGDLEVRPKLPAVFKTGGPMAVFFQVFDFMRAQGQPRLTVDYTIMKDNQIVRRTDVEPIVAEAAPTARSLFYGQNLSLVGLDPGHYTLQVKIIDQLSRRFAVKQTAFAVE